MKRLFCVIFAVTLLISVTMNQDPQAVDPNPGAPCQNCPDDNGAPPPPELDMPSVPPCENCSDDEPPPPPAPESAIFKSVSWPIFFIYLVVSTVELFHLASIHS
ncbi:hypothetical protein Btru_072954 [Bulinus truncatus]|nr:hypothetical protein Btru_072954 [Bulinus truncatus]